MKTLFMLMAQYDGAPMISAEQCCKDFFAPLTLPVFMRKVKEGDIDLTMIPMENSQKGARMIHLKDLADYIDKRRAAADKERKQMGA